MSSLWNNLESLQAWLSRAQWGLGVFGVITAVCTVAVLWLGDRVSFLQNAKNAPRTLTPAQQHAVAEQMRVWAKLPDSSELQRVAVFSTNGLFESVQLADHIA